MTTRLDTAAHLAEAARDVLDLLGERPNTTRIRTKGRAEPVYLRQLPTTSVDALRTALASWDARAPEGER